MKILYFLLLFLIISCEPFVDTLDEVQDCVYYSKNGAADASAKDTLLIMSWNIRFGCGTEILWFGESCGNRTILKRSEVEHNLNLIIDEINRLKPDILMMQELDIKSKRTAYIDQVQYILDRTYFKYAVYASDWNIQFIPSDGIGRINEGNVVFSVYPISEAKLHPLPLRNDLDALTKYFYLRENVQSCNINIQTGVQLRIINSHLLAYSTDDSKKRQLQEYIRILTDFNNAGGHLITGGDLNLLPPGSDSLDYCDEDKCSDEIIHSSSHHPFHKEGSNYADEIEWLMPLYNNYSPSLPLETYRHHQSKYFTHATYPNIPYDRTLDYLFIGIRQNSEWIENSHITHQDLRKLSDHCPISAKWRLK